MSSRIPNTASTTVTATYSIPTKFERPPATAPASTIAFPRWGSSSTCPGCHKAVSPMEIGVVPGPQGSRWHATCLVCGGKDAKRRSMRSEERKPGCGKRLDSAAKSDGEGGVWCRECLVRLDFPIFHRPCGIADAAAGFPAHRLVLVEPRYCPTVYGDDYFGATVHRIVGRCRRYGKTGHWGRPESHQTIDIQPDEADRRDSG